MITTRVFQSGNSQAVRLPRDFRLPDGEVEIFRRGDEIVIRELPRTKAGLGDAFDLLAALPAEIDERDDAVPQERDGL